MSDKISRFKKILEKSELNGREKALWSYFALNSSEKILSAVLEILEEKPEMIKFMTDNLQKKLEVLKTQDKEGWERLIKEEKELLERMEL